MQPTLPLVMTPSLALILTLTDELLLKFIVPMNRTPTHNNPDTTPPTPITEHIPVPIQELENSIWRLRGQNIHQRIRLGKTSGSREKYQP
ncbi:hypothetical protein Pcinc_041413 [Petrolisthes cinctipes]|uniref:Secreted protein n=1 Tax=Petrolisthes cinctipes TaxID=88211 RepID=A0AAE1BJM2_PETCI|nr:hypothetical protein Pcinc_041413 [Petrolisthes cinctipes]